MKKRKVRLRASLLLILGGMGMLLYPLLSHWREGIRQDAVIRTYQADVADMDRQEIEGAWAEAEAYNARLSRLVQIQEVFVSDFEAQNLGYEQLLNENADGVMSYIEIPCIEVFLPIYHGTSESVLAKGAGHMINTSLPVGGASTHCVISAHRGDPSAALFSNLDQLQQGDMFYLHTLNEKLAYKVDQIKVVLPHETDDFRIIEGEDYVTLVTCTPYGINTHRLLARGERVLEAAEKGAEEKDMRQKDTERAGRKQANLRFWLWGLVIVMGVGIALYPTLQRIWQKRSQQELIRMFLQGELPSKGQLKGKEMLGVLWIPKVECQLPIFRGTEEEVLKEGVGLMEGTGEMSKATDSEEGVHTVLCAHSGLPEVEAFDQIDALEKGDSIYIVSQEGVLAYTVTNQLTVLPEEVHLLVQPSPFANEITLLTCTPYGINTHRLLVQAELSRFFGGSAS